MLGLFLAAADDATPTPAEPPAPPPFELFGYPINYQSGVIFALLIVAIMLAWYLYAASRKNADAANPPPPPQ